ncbi:MAG: fluoride efflux transporter CrcB [Candidatus Microsaccharimonas sp.]
MYSYLIVFLGAGLGGAMRHGVNTTALRLLGANFPFGTLTVNVVGSLIMGFLAGYFAFKGDASQHWRLFMTTGVLGGFTTFSAFSLDAALLWEKGDVLVSIAYMFGSVLLSVGGLFLGMWLIKMIG